MRAEVYLEIQLEPLAGAEIAQGDVTAIGTMEEPALTVEIELLTARLPPGVAIIESIDGLGVHYPSKLDLWLEPETEQAFPGPQ